MIGTIKNNALIIFLIALISAIIFIPFIGNCPLFDWDEVNFAECAREMVVSGNYSQVQLNFRPFWEKPPFFIWLQAISMTIFGVNEFAARFPNAVCSIVSLIAIYWAGKKFHSQKFGIIWGLIYTSTLLPFLYFKSGLIDPFFNLFIFLSVYNCIQFLNNPNGKKELLNAFFAGLFLGAAVLTKGPTAIVIIGLTILVYTVWNKQIKILLSRSFIIFVLTTLFVSGSWFLIEWMNGNQTVVKEFIDYQIRLLSTEDSGHGGPFIYHFVVLLIGCFPASLLFVASYLNYKDLTPYQKQFRKIFVSLFWVVLLLFSFVVQTKIVHYSSLCYFPLTFVAAIGVVQNFERIKFSSLLKIIYWVVAGAFIIAFVSVCFIDDLKPYLLSGDLIKDEFALLNLKANVTWSGFEPFIIIPFLAGAILIFVAVNKHKINFLYYGFIANLLFIYFGINVIVPKVELYTQHAAIEFYEACGKTNCYVETQSFKSYAYLFYSNRKPSDYTNKNQLETIEEMLTIWEKEGHSRLSSYPQANLYWMEHNDIDRPAFVVLKTPNEKDISNNPELKKLYSKNGFSFFVRMPKKPAK